MAFIEWSPYLSVGVEEMDQQHRKLFDLMNALHNAVSEGKGGQMAKEAIEALWEYVTNHLAMEEKYLEEINYPDLEEHQSKHRVFVSNVLAMQERASAGETMTSGKLLEFMKTWWLDHINAVDKKYGVYSSMMSKGSS